MRQLPGSELPASLTMQGNLENLNDREAGERAARKTSRPECGPLISLAQTDTQSTLNLFGLRLFSARGQIEVRPGGRNSPFTFSASPSGGAFFLGLPIIEIAASYLPQRAMKNPSRPPASPSMPGSVRNQPSAVGSRPAGRLSKPIGSGARSMALV